MQTWRFFFLLLPVMASGQLIHRNLLQKKFPPSSLAAIMLPKDAYQPFPHSPAGWKQLLTDSLENELLNAAEKSLAGDFPGVPATTALDFSRNGNRTRYESITFPKRDRLWSLVLGEAIEGKKRFVDAIVNGIWSICEESFWGTSAHLYMQGAGAGLPDVTEPVVDLFAAETAATLAWVDYLVGDRLDEVSPLIRKRISGEVERRIFQPMRTAQYFWMGNGDTSARLNNWDPWIISNYLSAVLLLERDPAKRASALNLSIRLTDQFINGIGDDGACEEGPHYWSAAGGCLLDVLDLMASASKGTINIFDEPLIRNIGAYIYRTHIAGDYFVDVADSHPEVYPEAVMVWRYGQACKDPVMQSFGTWLYHNGHNRINGTFHRSRLLFDLVAVSRLQNDTSVYQPLASSWLPDVQLMTQRLPNGLFLAAHGGHNGESHNHNDVGDLIVYADGEPILIDVGSGTYTARTFSKDRYKLWFNTSAYHNLPTINGVQQSEGAAYSATQVEYRKTKTGVSLGMNLEKAYPAEGGISRWRRTITADNSSIVLKDEYVLSGTPSSLTQSFLTVNQPDISQVGKIQFTTGTGKRVYLHYGSGWKVTSETLPMATEEEKGLLVTWRKRPLVRILLTRTEPRSTDKLQYRISLQ